MGKDPRDAVMDLVIADRGETSVIISIMRRTMCARRWRIRWSRSAPTPARAPRTGRCRSRSRTRAAWGSFTRILGTYVRDEKLITLEDAIRDSPRGPATRIGMPDRGILRPGFKADITIFDPATVRDVSHTTDPNHYSEGILHVLVNGKAVVSNGAITDARPGQVIEERDIGNKRQRIW